MKLRTLLIGLISGMLLTSCSVNTSSNIDVDGDDIKYIKDDRTGLCFGFTASRKTMSASTTGLGMTCVPCEAVEKLLDD